MARSVIQSSEDEVPQGSHAPEEIVSDQEPEGPVGLPDGLEHPVGVPDKGRRETLLDLADEEGSDVTWDEFKYVAGQDLKQLHKEVVELMQNFRDLNARHQELRTYYKKSKADGQKQEAMIKGLLLRQNRQKTLSDTSNYTQQTAKIKDLLTFSGKFKNSTLFDN